MSTNETNKPTPPPQDLQAELVKLSKSTEFKQYVADVLVLLNAVLSVFLWRRNYKVSNFFYKVAFLFAGSSLGLNLYKKYHTGIPATNKLLADESFQYFIYVSLFTILERKFFALIPIGVIALFNALTYAKSTVLPLTKYNTVWSPRIENFITGYKSSFYVVVSSIEFTLLLFVIVDALLFRARSWVTLVVYFIFFKLRFETSELSRGSVKQWEVRLDRLTASPSVPPVVKNTWVQFKSSIAKIPTLVHEKKQE